MKVRMLQSLSGPKVNLSKGAEVELSDKEAKQYIKAKLAIKIIIESEAEQTDIHAKSSTDNGASKPRKRKSTSKNR